jgi:hypothetical protein
MIERYSTMRDMSAILQCRGCPKGDEATAGHKVEDTDATPSLRRQHAGPVRAKQQETLGRVCNV